jgi:uncharacterized protein YneF (UPF0154 family)
MIFLYIILAFIFGYIFGSILNVKRYRKYLLRSAPISQPEELEVFNGMRKRLKIK